MAKTPPKIVSTKYPSLRVVVKVKGHHFEALALLDTGFTGHVAIPRSVFNGDLGWPDLKFTWKLADGSFVETPVYHGLVQIVGLKSAPALITILGDEYILGRGVIDRFKFTFDHGRKVIVEP